METFKCSKCAKLFSYKKSLARHEKSDVCVQKNNEVMKSRTSIKCPKSECQLIFSCRELFLNHTKSVHGVNLEVDKWIFGTHNDFQKWKMLIEKETLSYYYMKSSSKSSLQGVKQIYLDCHRSGYFKSKSKNVRSMKSQGSNKMNSTCTSFMKVMEYPDKKIEVTFCKTHFGHDSNIGRWYLPKEERAKYALKEDDIRAGHQASLEIDKSKIQRLSEDSWIAPSSTIKNLSHVVRRVRNTCKIRKTDCQLRCRSCNICCHLYVCDCPDHVSKLNICEHIHACISTLSEHSVEENDTVVDLVDDENSIPIEKALRVDENQDIGEHKRVTIQKAETMLGFLYNNECTAEEYDEIQKKLDSILDIFGKEKRKIVAVEKENNEPANEKVAQQICFSSNKKVSITPHLRQS